MVAVDFGIMALASSIGEPYDVVADARRYGVAAALAERMGFRTFHKAPAGATMVTFAVAAARNALDRAGVHGTEVDHLVVASASMPEYFHWDMSTAVARDLGLRDVPTLILTQACISAVLAFQYVGGLFAVRSDLRTVLFVATERICDAHVNRMTNGATADSDGAVAAVLRRDHPALRWLASEQLTDSTYADFFRLEYGGCAAPFAPAGCGNRDLDPAYSIFQFFQGDAARFAEYAAMTDARLVEAVDGACKRAGVPRADLVKIFLLHANQVALRSQAKVLGVPLSTTNADLAAALGHFGAMDPLVSLDICIGRGELTAGGVVALAGMSSGLHWACSLIEV
jgi:3-oxoacyl-[acyl-carrier-protein] synthase-3